MEKLSILLFGFMGIGFAIAGIIVFYKTHNPSDAAFLFALSFLNAIQFYLSVRKEE